MEGVDYSFSRPSPYCLYRGNKRFVVRYVGTPASGKNLTANERDAIVDAKLDIVGVYETTTGFMLEGYDRGTRAATSVAADAIKYNRPVNTPTYYALDVDPRNLSRSQWDAIKAFLNGVASVVGRKQVGVYGGFAAIETLVPQWAAYGWQTYAWSGGQISSEAHLYQYKNGVELCSATVDLCRNLADEYGQWYHHAPEHSSIDVPIGAKEEEMGFLYTSPGKPVFYCYAGKSVGLNEASDLAAFKDCVVRHLDADTFAKFRARYPGD